MDTILRIHWLGKQKISGDTNSSGFMSIWEMPESAGLETEVIEKLSTAPWRLLRGEANRSSAKLLVPLLHDLLEQESYVEICQPSNPTNQPGEMVIAIRLSEDRAELWKTNLATALESLTGIRPASVGRGWSLKKHHIPNLIQLARVGEWTVLGAAQEQNDLFNLTVAHVQNDHQPFRSVLTNCWLQVDTDLPRVAVALGRTANLPAVFPKISFSFGGDGKEVHTRGELDFAQPIVAGLEPWNIPTNLIDADLFSFSAVRGWTPGLLLRLWKEAGISNPPPREYYVWSLNGAPMQTYFAAPAADASNVVSKLSDFVVGENKTSFATNDMVRFQRAKKFNGVEWRGAPFVSPFLKSVETAQGGFIFAGFFPSATPRQLPPQLVRDLRDRSDLFYFDWELTGPRIQQLIYLSQFMRFVEGRPQLPARSASLKFLLQMAKTLGSSRTEIVRAAPQRFGFERSSEIPFTALELQILAGWVESPQFPELDSQIRIFHKNGSNGAGY